ncbi:MAG TPA: aspartate/glutamate racemase family protein [Acidobacteriaceae bacterium]|nr:aspartate/glutamate racemase family protein [Acidobacteriaceae bacterium]
MKTVYAIHTGPILVEVMKQLFPEILPEVKLVNIVDDGLLTDLRAAGVLTPQLRRRLVGYGLIAEAAGADVILNCCSSVGEAADSLAALVSIPVVKIDDRMAQTAVAAGHRVGIVATVSTTLDPTERLVQRKALASGKTITTSRYLAGAAFEALLAGDAARHDELLKSEIVRAASENDVVVLAQGSMARLVPQLAGSVNVPVLSSPRLGVEALRDVLEAQ